DWQQLPRAVIHADIFRDNVLFDGDRVSGIIDFYYACHDYQLLDLAVICNDWCFDTRTRFLPARWQAFISAYNQHHALTASDQRAWPGMLRAAALRFWASRLYDYHFPMDGDVTHIHDPLPFERLLRRHRDNPPPLLPTPLSPCCSAYPGLQSASRAKPSPRSTTAFSPWSPPCAVTMRRARNTWLSGYSNTACLPINAGA